MSPPGDPSLDGQEVSVMGIGFDGGLIYFWQGGGGGGGEMFGVQAVTQVHVVDAKDFAALRMISVQEG